MTTLDISRYPGKLPEHDVSGPLVVARFERNPRGRDFVVGDIHGMFSHLEVLMERVGFEADRDRMFSVGDLVDRGPHSAAALEWLSYPWFHACRGNHEQFALDSEDPEQLDLWLNYNGGQWWADLSTAEQALYRRRFGGLPLVMEIDTGSGAVGIVHADVPPMVSWEGFVDLLRRGDENALFYALWSRMRISGEFTEPVRGGVDRIYCGHTPTRTTVLVGNVCYIDTGAVYSCEGYQDARLTVVEIHPDTHVEHEIRTYDSI